MIVHPDGIRFAPYSSVNADGLLNVPEAETPETQLIVELFELFQSVKLTFMDVNEVQPLNIP